MFFHRRKELLISYAINIPFILFSLYILGYLIDTQYLLNYSCITKGVIFTLLFLIVYCLFYFIILRPFLKFYLFLYKQITGKDQIKDHLEIEFSTLLEVLDFKDFVYFSIFSFYKIFAVIFCLCVIFYISSYFFLPLAFLDIIFKITALSFALLLLSFSLFFMVIHTVFEYGK